MAASGGRVGSASASNGSLTGDFDSSAKPLTMSEAVAGQQTRDSSPSNAPDSSARPGSGMSPQQQHFCALLPRIVGACHACVLTLSSCLHLKSLAEARVLPRQFPGTCPHFRPIVKQYHAEGGEASNGASSPSLASTFQQKSPQEARRGSTWGPDPGSKAKGGKRRMVRDQIDENYDSALRTLSPLRY